MSAGALFMADNGTLSPHACSSYWPRFLLSSCSAPAVPTQFADVLCDLVPLPRRLILVGSRSLTAGRRNLTATPFAAVLRSATARHEGARREPAVPWFCAPNLRLRANRCARGVYFRHPRLGHGVHGSAFLAKTVSNVQPCHDRSGQVAGDALRGRRASLVRLVYRPSTPR